MGRRTLDIDLVKQRYLSFGLVFLDKSYINCRYKHNIKCKCGQIFQTN